MGSKIQSAPNFLKAEHRLDFVAGFHLRHPLHAQNSDSWWQSSKWCKLVPFIYIYIYTYTYCLDGDDDGDDHDGDDDDDNDDDEFIYDYDIKHRHGIVYVIV